MQQRERQPAGMERLQRQVQQDRGILADRVEQDRVLALRRRPRAGCGCSPPRGAADASAGAGARPAIGGRAAAVMRGSSMFDASRAGRAELRLRLQCRPHSFLASSSHHQRPARSGSPTPHGARAGRAADRREAAVVQRVVGNAVIGHVALDVGAAPVGERVELDETVGRRRARRRACRRGARDCSARKPGDPAGRAVERAAERLDLADAAARLAGLDEARKPLMPCCADAGPRASSGRGAKAAMRRP